MHSNRLDRITQGVMGYFTSSMTFSIDAARNERGHLSIDERGVVRLITLDESTNIQDLMQEHIPVPDLVVGATEQGGILLLGLTGRGRTTNVGGVAHASGYRYRSTLAVIGVRASTITTSKLASMSAQFEGITAWCGLTTSTISQELDDLGQPTALSIRVESPPDQVARLGSMAMTIGTDWKVDGPTDKRVIETPMFVTVSAPTGRAFGDFLHTLEGARDLVSIAYDGLVQASSCEATLPGQPERRELWSQQLISRPPGSTTAKTTEYPLFYLKDIGGVAGLSRWVRLCAAHPRATSVIALGAKTPSAPIPSLLTVCSAIEYWGAANRRTAAWTRTKPWPLALARHVGSTFKKWVGDDEKWAAELWTTYGLLKHAASTDLSPRRVLVLAESARMLLMSALLNRTAMSKAPSARMFNSHRLYGLGDELRQTW